MDQIFNLKFTSGSGMQGCRLPQADGCLYNAGKQHTWQRGSPACKKAGPPGPPVCTAGKQLVRQAAKCEKEEKAERLKIKKAIEKGGCSVQGAPWFGGWVRSSTVRCTAAAARSCSWRSGVIPLAKEGTDSVLPSLLVPAPLRLCCPGADIAAFPTEPPLVKATRGATRLSATLQGKVWGGHSISGFPPLHFL